MLSVPRLAEPFSFLTRPKTRRRRGAFANRCARRVSRYGSMGTAGWGEFPQEDPPAERRGTARGGRRRDHPRDLRRGRRARKSRAPRRDHRANTKRIRRNRPEARHALRPAAVSRGLVQQGSCAGCAAHNPPGWVFHPQRQLSEKTPKTLYQMQHIAHSISAIRAIISVPANYHPAMASSLILSP